MCVCVCVCVCVWMCEHVCVWKCVNVWICLHVWMRVWMWGETCTSIHVHKCTWNSTRQWPVCFPRAEFFDSLSHSMALLLSSLWEGPRWQHWLPTPCRSSSRRYHLHSYIYRAGRNPDTSWATPPLRVNEKIPTSKRVEKAETSSPQKPHSWHRAIYLGGSP